MNFLMQQEAAESPNIIKQQWQKNKLLLEELIKRLHQSPPPFAMTIARGSSDNAATFAKYLLETYIGIVTASAAPSTLTLYNKTLYCKGSLVIGISQSGQSPDICEMMAAAKKTGAITVAFVNQVNSPMAETAEYVIPLWAGQEKAVAATKTYLASVSALIQFIAIYADDKKLLHCGKQLPEVMNNSLTIDTNVLITGLGEINNLLILARGYGFPIAQEIALKFKETMAMYAEAISSAEVLHGPFALIKANNPVLMLAQGDISLPSLIRLAERMQAMQAKVLLTIPCDKITDEQRCNIGEYCLLLPPTLHPVCDPLISAQVLYLMIAKLALKRGFNPDQPEQLSKVTKTL